MLKAFLVNLALLLVIIAGIMVAFWFALPYLPRFATAPRISKTPVILTQVQSLSQLVTVKYVLEKVVIVEDESHWYELQLGENRLLMVAHGIVKAGSTSPNFNPPTSPSPAKKSPSPCRRPASPIRISTTISPRLLTAKQGCSAVSTKTSNKARGARPSKTSAAPPATTAS